MFPVNSSSIATAQQYRKIENPTMRTGKIGKYQMTENQMASLGYYSLPDGDNGLSNKWRGTWTGRRNIKSLDDFLNNHDAQEFVIREAMRHHWRLIRCNKIDELVGTKAHGVLLTESTLLAIAHLMGDEGVVALAPKSKAMDSLDFGNLTQIAGFQTPYDKDPERNWVQKEMKQYLRKGDAPTLNSDLSTIARNSVEQYTWCTQCDDKVRQSHAEKEGEMCQIGDSPEPSEEENCRCFREDDINDAYNEEIEKQALAIKRSCLASSIKTYEDAKKFVAQHNGQLINNSYQCAALTHLLAPELGPASSWTRGILVQGNTSIPIGTPIATFNFYGNVGTNGYGPASNPGGKSGSSHTGIYLGQNDTGVEILNIYKNSKGPKIETIPWNIWNDSSDEAGSKYYTIDN